ncbi:MAG: MFS transporter [Ruminococcus sp.]|jgi:MFS family permease
MNNTEKMKKTFIWQCEENLAGKTPWPYDVPVKAQVNEFIPEICRLPYDYLFRDDPVAMAECTLLVQEYLGLDSIHSNLDMYNFEPSNIGANIVYYKNHIPDIDRSNYFIKGKEDLEKIRYQGKDKGQIQYLIDYCKAYKEYVGLDYAPTLNSPWNLAANLFGLENLVMEALSDPDFVHDLMRRIVCDLQAPLLEDLVKEIDGLPYVIGADAWASLPIVSVDLLEEFDKPYVELLNKTADIDIPFVSGGYWGFRYLEGEAREKLMDYTIEIGGGTLYVYDPDPHLVGPDYFREYADRKQVPLLFGVMNTVMESGSADDVIEYTKRFVLAGGLIPFFYAPNWTFVLVMRAFLGVGVGFYSLRNPLLVKTVPPEKLARYVGIGGMINNAFQIILNPLAGSLAQSGWQYSLLINLVIVIVGIIGILFLKEPEKERATESHLHQEKRKVPGKVWGYVLLQFLLTTVTYPVISGMSTFVVDKNLGSPVIAGTLISIYMAGGIVINLILPRLQKVLGNAMICAAFLITAAGSAIILFVPSFAAVAVGVFCCGLGFLSMFSIFQVLNGLVCQKENVDLGSTLILAANQLGVFVSSYFITASTLVFHFGSEMENSFLGACAATAVLALLTFVFRSRIYPDHGK